MFGPTQGLGVGARWHRTAVNASNQIADREFGHADSGSNTGAPNMRRKDSVGEAEKRMIGAGGLPGKHVEAHRGKVPRAERPGEGHLVDDSASSRVDQNRAGLNGSQRL